MSKVPFLADIPILGNLFKKKNRTNSKAELLIFVTPKVLRVAQR
jgi:type IV pilus assembly protein PilQ